MKVSLLHYRSMIDLTQFEATIWTKHKTHLKMHSGEKSNKCNQCDYASSRVGHLRTHLKAHSGEKLNKCNQCNYASSGAGNLRTHLKMHSGEKSNKCNQCDYASSQAGHLRRHLKTHSGEKPTSATNVTMPLLRLAIWGRIWKRTEGKSKQCSQCDFASFGAGILRRHLKNKYRFRCLDFSRRLDF